MESRRRGKRKSPSQDIIFEVSDDDISPEPSDNECSEPDAKILKTDENIFHLISSGDSNLEGDKQIITPKVPPITENDETTIVIIDSNSQLNDSSLEICSSTNDIIDITAEDTPDLSEEICLKPDEGSVDIEIVVDTEKQNPSPLSEVDVILEEGELELEIPKTIKKKSTDIETDDVDSNKCAPCICITFRDNDVAELYKFKFMKFIQTFVELEVKSFDGLTVTVERDSALNPTEWVVLDETICISDVKELTKEDSLISSQEKSPGKKKKKKKNKKEKDLFILDTNPSIEENNGLCTKYSSKFQIDSEKSTPEEETEKKISAQICFNCDGHHALKDCTVPKNFGKINAARQRLRSQKQTSRYHLEEDQKYGHLMPGKISDKLREALGLRNNQLPPYIYHMRSLGYPPGWLEEAKFVHSNLEMFDSDGNNVRGTAKKKQGLDPERIINYPGFNTSIPNDVKDEYRHYHVPPFSEQFSKQAMIEFFEKQFSKEQDDFEMHDMDLDASFEETKGNVTIKVEPPVVENKESAVVNPLLNELKEIDSNISSPSLTDLEKVKENLLAALEDNSTSNPTKSVETAGVEPDNSDREISAAVEKTQPSKIPIDENLVIDIEKAQDSSSSFSSPPLTGSANTVKNSTFGTPILKSDSPYSRLPNPDNFMKDVSPVINFENLPNSTGKYEQMTEVLQKVRSTLRKNLQNCKS